MTLDSASTISMAYLSIKYTNSWAWKVRDHIKFSAIIPQMSDIKENGMTIICYQQAWRKGTEERHKKALVK